VSAVSSRTAMLCPSAQPDWPESVVIAVVDGRSSEPRVIPLAEPQPVGPELMALAGPVRPTEVFRFAAPCAEDRCRHFRDKTCTLVERVIKNLTSADASVPYCRIRSKCRWWNQEGKAACLRCTQIVTDGYPATEARLRIGIVPPP
jgi:hypothetical protein